MLSRRDDYEFTHKLLPYTVYNKGKMIIDGTLRDNELFIKYHKDTKCKKIYLYGECFTKLDLINTGAI